MGKSLEGWRDAESRVHRDAHREQNGILFRRNPEFVVERVMQDFLHVVPIRDDTNDGQYLYPALGWQPP